MNAVSKELDNRLSRWTPMIARRVEQVVSDIIALADAEDSNSSGRATSEICWPDGFFARTAGVLSDAPIVRAQPTDYDQRANLQ